MCRERPLEGLRDGRRLARACGDHHQATGVQDGRHPHGDGIGGDATQIPAKPVRIVTARVFVKADAVRPRLQLRGRFVEADVPIGPDAEQLKAQTSCTRDLCLVPSAFHVEVRCSPVEKVGVQRTHVHDIDEMLADEAAEARRMRAFDAGELIQGKRAHATEIHLPRRVCLPKSLVGTDGCASGREPQHQ